MLQAAMSLLAAPPSEVRHEPNQPPAESTLPEEAADEDDPHAPCHHAPVEEVVETADELLDEPQSLVCHQEPVEDAVVTALLEEEPENRFENQGAEADEEDVALTALLLPPYSAERNTSSASTGWLELAVDTAEPPPQVLFENHESAEELTCALPPQAAALETPLTDEAFRLSNTGREYCHKSDAVALRDDSVNTRNVLPSTCLVILLFVPSSGIGCS